MTAIEWTDETWNPVVGCSVKSPGCTHCYAMPMAARLERIGMAQYAGLTTPSKAGPVFNGKVAQAPESILLKPLSWKRARMIFVNSMGDLFHENVPDEWIDPVFAVMLECPQHIFQVLTKRGARMRAYMAQWRQEGRYVVSTTRQSRDPRDGNKFFLLGEGQQWPLANVWMGVSAEDQTRADERIPVLLQTPAAVRFVSAEPLLGPLELWFAFKDPCKPSLPSLDWLIVGGESGKGARPMHPDWATSLRDQCAAAGVPFFFKQWGAFAPEVRGRYRKVGKKAAGRLLDGQEHNGFPCEERA